VSFGVTPTLVALGETVEFTASVTVNNTGLYTMTWDYGDGVGGAGPVTRITTTMGVVGPLSYGYTEPGTYDATASVEQTATTSDTITTGPIEVTVEGPTPAVTVTSAIFGEPVVFEIDNYVSGVISGAVVMIDSPSGMTYSSTVAVDSDVVETDLVYGDTQSGTYSVTVTLDPEPSFDLAEGPGDTVEVVDQPVFVEAAEATLSASSTSVDVDESVTFNGAVTNVITDAVVSYTFDFGNNESDTDAPTTSLTATATYSYSMAGTYNVTFTAMLSNSVEISATETITVSAVTVGDTQLEVTTTATDNELVVDGSAEVVATLTDADDAVVAGETVTLTLQAPVYGMRLDGTTEVSGTTDASGSFTATLTAGSFPSNPNAVTVAASAAGADDASVDVTSVAPEGSNISTGVLTLSSDAAGSQVEITLSDGRTVTIQLPQQDDDALNGFPLYVSIEELAATDAPSGTIGVVDFFVRVYLGDDISDELTEGTEVTAEDAGTAGVNLAGAQVTISFTADELNTLGIDPATLMVYDIDGEDFRSLTTAAGDTSVTADILGFGRHILAGEPVQTGTTLYLPLVAR
jgi:PKD repeat protein